MMRRVEPQVKYDKVRTDEDRESPPSNRYDDEDDATSLLAPSTID